MLLEQVAQLGADWGAQPVANISWQFARDFCAWSGWQKPETFTGQMVTDYLSHLATERKVAAATQNQAFNALLFLFRFGRNQ